MLYKKLEKIKLNNGKCLSRLYGKYKPNLTIITGDDVYIYEDLPEDEKLAEYFQKFTEGYIVVRRGEYRRNAKGTDIFDFTKNGNILVELYWYDNKNPNLNLNINNLKPLYYRCTGSNNGLSGVTYYIFPEDIETENKAS